uniref:ORF77 n=1 Tax=Oryza sativa subsp. japonica TaxID=39947 RepID=Q35318_ORYSJ|nr:ORF77 [Oryza sativa Japonica Group]
MGFRARYPHRIPPGKRCRKGNSPVLTLIQFRKFPWNTYSGLFQIGESHPQATPRRTLNLNLEKKMPGHQTTKFNMML